MYNILVLYRVFSRFFFDKGSTVLMPSNLNAVRDIIAKCLGILGYEYAELYFEVKNMFPLRIPNNLKINQNRFWQF